MSMIISILKKREGPIVLVSVCMMLMLITYYFNIPQLSQTVTDVSNFAVILSAFFYFIGITRYFTSYSYGEIRAKRREWWLQWVTIGTFVVSMICACIPPFAKAPIFSWVIANVRGSIYATTFACVGFALVAGAYRGLRARNYEATIMTIFGVIVVLGNWPLPKIYTSFFADATNWILSYPSMTATRGITIGAALGLIAVVLRTVTGRERAMISD